MACAFEIATRHNITPNLYETHAKTIEYLPPHLETNVKFSIKNRQEAITYANEEKDNRTILIYTDGSKIDEHTGNAFVAYCPPPLESIFRRFKLQKDNSVFQNELFAIQAAVIWITSLAPGIKQQYRFEIFTDSLSSINDLMSNNNKNSRTLSILKVLTMETINLTIHWCPGHEGVYGNEAVDKIAKKAALGDSETIFAPLPISHAKLLVRQNTNISHDKEYLESTSRIKQFFPTLAGLKNFLQKTNYVPYQMIQILSGHSRLNAYLHTIGYSDSSFCSCGMNKVETLDHFIFECNNYKHLRTSLKFVASVLFIEWPFKVEKIVDNDHLYSAFQ